MAGILARLERQLQMIAYAPDANRWARDRARAALFDVEAFREAERARAEAEQERDRRGEAEYKAWIRHREAMLDMHVNRWAKAWSELTDVEREQWRQNAERREVLRQMMRDDEADGQI